MYNRKQTYSFENKLEKLIEKHFDSAVAGEAKWLLYWRVDDVVATTIIDSALSSVIKTIKDKLNA